MSDYRKSQVARVLVLGSLQGSAFYRLQVSADGTDEPSKHLNISEDELRAIRDLLACQHQSGTYSQYDGIVHAGTYCNDCDAAVVPTH